ncbi:ABC transporter substrate-binding protein [Streptomyces sp. Wb2n-11]|uniref:ABC transporter substrate-binding protein n=1 Tax=Streptomyces sp. Wb2n-11 TaxID=1030533 RepID=UPI000A474498|nr:ABC transporter substrate-binding protein [Streptomyces sp. Wb2n-11]
MFNRTRRLQSTAALASISLLTGCGVLSGDRSDTEQKLAVGTTSTPSTLDPAGAWDGSWELYRNVFQTLVSYPVGSAAPEPDAAEKCSFTDGSSKVYSCTLRKGLTFSDGTELDAAAVKHSIDRISAIGAEGGPSGLLTSLDRVETSGDRKVTFHLNKPDATFPFVLATPAMSLVSPADYPKNKLREGSGLTGSGPYNLASYEPDKTAELVKNPKYDGFAELKNDAVTIRYFKDSALMVEALKKKEIDATFRGLTAEQVIDLQDQPKEKALQVVEAVGAEIRYLVFNPEDSAARNPAVRRAIAQVIDRGALVDKVYKGTAEPLYSMIPSGVAGHATSFFDTYGEPNVPKARNMLAEAGITEPVPLTFWYTSDRYGSATALEFAELKRQLDASGLFRITLKHRPWNTFQKGYQKGEFPVFGRGWSPDFPDPDNFVAPFVGENNAVGTPYETPEITASLLPKTRQESDRAAVGEQFGRAQEILLKDVRLLPLWQGKLYVAASDDIAGAERALDPQTIMQVWQLHRKTSW